MDKGGIDLAILDGEAVPAGGMGICRQLKDEIYQCPPVLVLTGRPAGRAGWPPGRAPTPRCRTRSTRSRLAEARRPGCCARGPQPAIRLADRRDRVGLADLAAACSTRCCARAT